MLLAKIGRLNIQVLIRDEKAVSKRKDLTWKGQKKSRDALVACIAVFKSKRWRWGIVYYYYCVRADELAQPENRGKEEGTSRAEPLVGIHCGAHPTN